MIKGESAGDTQETKSNVIQTGRDCDDNKPTFNDLIKASNSIKSEVVDLTSPVRQQPVKRSKSLLDSYGSQGPADVKPGDFLSRLSSSSKAIDFNNTASYKATTTISQPSTAMATKIKEEPSSRKRKYKLVDNEPAKSGPLGVVGNGTGSEERLPEDKAQLIKMVKDRLDKDDYKRLLNALKQYQATCCVSVLYEEMSSVFAKPQHHFMLRGMGRFVKEGSQREEFEELLIKNNIQ